MTTRKQDINYFVNNNIINYNLQNIQEIYKEELKDYKYIENEQEFSELKLKGSLRYINIHDLKLRYGGLLIKIYYKNNNWYGVIKQQNKHYYINYKNNYIFYLDSKDNLIRNWANLFISNYNDGLYN